MSGFESLERYLRSQAREGGSRQEGFSRAVRPFVTISRQTGAGGHTLAEAILAEMRKAERWPLFQGWRMFDQEICREVARNPRLKVSLEWLLAKEYRSETEDLMAYALAGSAPQSAVMRETFSVVRGLAAAGKAVIVGRAGSCLTRGMPLGVHLRLVAPQDVRVRRMMDRLELTEPAAARLVKEQDEARARLVRDYFGREIDDPLLYDCVWNTETVPMSAIAAGVVRLLERKHLDRTGLNGGPAPARR